MRTKPIPPRSASSRRSCCRGGGRRPGRPARRRGWAIAGRDVSGNEEMFRSQINEREGFLLRSLSFGLGDIRRHERHRPLPHRRGRPRRRAERAFRLEAGRTGLLEAQRVLPAHRAATRTCPTIANPLPGEGDPRSQHSFDRTRDIGGRRPRALPGKAVTAAPRLQLQPLRGTRPDDLPRRRRTSSGSTRTSKEKDTEYRIGVAFDAGPVSGQVVQGWRQFRGEETLTLSPGAERRQQPRDDPGRAGSRLTSLSRTTKTDVDTPVTSAVVTGKLGKAVRLTGTYIRAKADGEDTAPRTSPAASSRTTS